MLEETEVRTIGKYEIIGPLGRGSMGLVYKGRDPEIGRLVAIKTLRKLLPTHMQSADLALERFRNEARSAGNLRHPHIITIFEVSRDQDTPYIVMDYVEGNSLEGVLEKEEKLSLDRTLHYLSQVAQGLDYAHEKGVIHKDIKPGNIFVDKSHNVFILDFGIATISESMGDGGPAAGGPALGTPGYMSPEQILSERIDSRTDLFSLAIVAFECLTGQRPFPGATFTEVVGNILNAKPLSLTTLAPNLPLALEVEFERALSKEKTARHGSAREMIEAFAKAAGVDERPGKGYLKPARNEVDHAWTTPGAGGAYGATPRTDLLVMGGPGSMGRGREALRKTGGWPVAENPGDIFEHDNRVVRGMLNFSKFTPIQALTFFLGAVAVVMALVLFYEVFQPQAVPPPVASGNPAAPDGVEAPPAVSQNGALISPEIESAPAGLPVNALSNKQLLGVLVNSASPEGLLLDALHEAYNRKVPQLVDTCVELLQHDSYVVRIEAIKTVAQIGDRRIVPRLLQNLDDHDPLVRGQAAKALGTLGDRAALGYLSQRMVSEEVPEVKSSMRAAIEKINGFPLKDPA